MAIKVGINGFGRIARVVLRSLESRETSLQVCAINVRNANLDRMVYMLKYDTVFGRFQGEIKAVEDAAWKKTDPEADARKSSFEEQLTAQLAELDEKIATESDPKKKAKLEAEKATKEQWLNAIK